MFAKEGDGSLNEVFEKLTAKELPLPPFGKIVALPSNLSVAEACRELGKYNILAAPVRDVSEPDESSWVYKYIGIVDFLGMVDWMVKRVKGKMPESFAELLALEEAFQTTTIKELAETSRWSPFVPIDPSSEPSVLLAMVILGKYGISRVCITESSGDLTNVVTQTTMAQFILGHMDVLGAVGTKSIKELGLLEDDLCEDAVTINQRQTYWDAFRLMSDMLISAVPIVDDDNKLVGTISVKDIRKMILDPVRFKILTAPLSEFDGFSKRHLTCAPSDTLETAMDRIVRHHVHRLWILNDKGEVRGVLSLRDCIAIFVKEPGASPLPRYFTAQSSAK